MTASAATAKRHLLAMIAGELLPRGFRRSGVTFWRTAAGDRQLVRVQFRRVDDDVLVTFDLGIVVAPIAQFLGLSSGDWNDVAWAHWRARIGRYLPARQDYWWPLVVAGEVNPEPVAALVEHGIPALERSANYPALMEAWAPDLEYPLPCLYSAIVAHALGHQDDTALFTARLARFGYEAEPWTGRLDRLRLLVGAIASVPDRDEIQVATSVTDALRIAGIGDADPDRLDPPPGSAIETVERLLGVRLERPEAASRLVHVEGAGGQRAAWVVAGGTTGDPAAGPATAVALFDARTGLPVQLRLLQAVAWLPGREALRE